jgi:hypothetical protein
MAINKLNKVPYDDFKLLEVIDPQHFDTNNATLVTKIDEIIDDVNTKVATIIDLTNTVNTNETDIENKFTTLSNTVVANETDIENKVSIHKTSTVLDHPDASVTTVKIADSAVTTQKINNGAITLDKLDSSIATQVGLGEVNAKIITLENEVKNSISHANMSLSNVASTVSYDVKVDGGIDFEFDAQPLFVNYISPYGGCESTTGWTGLLTFDDTIKLFGTGSLKVNASASQNGYSYIDLSDVGTNYYFVSAHAYITTADLQDIVLNAYAKGSSVAPTSVIFDKTIINSWQRKGLIVSKADGLRILIGRVGVGNTAGNIDGVAVYKLIQSEYDAYIAGTLTIDQLLAKYPYVNGIQPLSNLNIKSVNGDKSSEILIEGDFAGLSSTYRNHVSRKNGKVEMLKKIKKYALQATDITELVTTITEYDYLIIPNTKLSDYACGSDSTANNRIAINGFLQEFAMTETPTIFPSFASGQTEIRLYVSKGKYATLADAQSALAGTVVWYALNTPVTENITPKIDGLVAYKGNTTFSLIMNANENNSQQVSLVLSITENLIDSYSELVKYVSQLINNTTMHRRIIYWDGTGTEPTTNNGDMLIKYKP